MTYKYNPPGYHTWKGMRQRCQNPSHPRFKDYGGRGIQVCPEWNDYNTFWNDMGGTWFQDATLERKDNDGDYCPSNCVWIIRGAQAANTRQNRWVETPYGDFSPNDIALITGLSAKLIRERMGYGWTPEKIFAPKTQRRSVGGMSVSDAAQKTGLSVFTIHARIRAGWTDEYVLDKQRHGGHR